MAKGNRKAAEKEILDFMSKWKGGANMIAAYTEKFKRLSDAQFEAWMEDFNTGVDYLRAVIPNGGDIKLTVEDNIKMADSIGHNFFERVWLVDESTQHRYLTNHEFFTIALPLKSQIQLLFKKISVAKDNKSIDMLSGQVTGDSKGGGISKPEAQILYAMGLNEALKEPLKARGGDRITQLAFDKAIHETGTADIDVAMSGGGKVQGRQLLSMWLKAQHIDNDLG